MNELEEIKKKVSQAITLLHQAIELSIPLKAGGGIAAKDVNKVWQEFLVDFWGCIRDKSKQHKLNLLSGIRWPRV